MKVAGLVVGSMLFSALFLLPAAAAGQESVTIEEGTEVRLRLLEPLSSATAQQGQRFNLELDDDVRIDDVVVVPLGSKAVGTVTHAKKRGFMGKGGDLNVSIDYMLVGDRRVRLRATSGKEGDDKVGATVALTILFGPLGLLKRGKDIVVNAGTPFTAYVDQTAKVPVRSN